MGIYSSDAEESSEGEAGPSPPGAAAAAAAAAPSFLLGPDMQQELRALLRRIHGTCGLATSDEAIGERLTGLLEALKPGARGGRLHRERGPPSAHFETHSVSSLCLTRSFLPLPSFPPPLCPSVSPQ
jgi:hypothetical protein